MTPMEKDSSGEAEKGHHSFLAKSEHIVDLTMNHTYFVIAHESGIFFVHLNMCSYLWDLSMGI